MHFGAETLLTRLIRVSTAGELWDLLEEGVFPAGDNDWTDALNGSGSFGGHSEERPSNHIGDTGALPGVANPDDKSRPSSSPVVVDSGPVFQATVDTDEEVQ
ncbi:hypothetical protein MTO96_007107 [Rhipicephalus appendiculatus]